MTVSDARLSIRATLPLGVELNGDLRAPLERNERVELARLLDRHGLLVFRGQQLTHEQQVDIMSCCGPILRAPDGIGFISTNKEKGGLGAVELAYHSDLAFTSTPFRAISLLAI